MRTAGCEPPATQALEGGAPAAGKGRRIEVRLRFGEPGAEAAFTPVEDADYEGYCRRAGLSSAPESVTPNEWMAIATARRTPDGAFVFAGTGLPMIGCMLAQHTYAPSSVIVMESGIVGPEIRHLPISVADPRASYGCTLVGGMLDTFGSMASRGYCTAGILGAAECDRFGNLNSTSIGGHLPGGVQASGRGPRVRLAGSGGANPIASLADFVMVMMVHERRRFPERVEHLTSPAGVRGPRGSAEDRRACGLSRGRRCVVISDLAVLATSPDGGGELRLESIYPGVDEEAVLRNTGWPLERSPDFAVAPPPSYAELKVLRCLVDPQRVYLNR